MAKDWTGQVREQDRQRVQRTRDRAESSRRRRRNRRREWTQKPLRTALRQITGRR